MPSIGINPFVRRQTPDSRFSHFDGELQRVANMAKDMFSKAKPGYRDGVLLVSVPASGFYSGVVELTAETKLKTTFEARRKGEDPVKVTVAIGADKLPAEHVELVLYRRDVLLEEGPDAVGSECEWELVSINARPTPEAEPMTPDAMARNFLELPGGTKADYTAEEFARSILYWSCRAMAGE